MLTYFVMAPILMAVFLYLFFFAKITRIIVIVAQIALLCAACYLFFLSRGENVVVTNIGNYDGFLGITLMSDPLTSVFVLLTAFLFLLVTIYSFFENDSRLFWFLMFLWQGLLIGVFLTRDLFNIFVLKEVATVVVAVLIMFERDKRSMYDGIIYLMVNIVVMQFYLFGIGYVYKITGVLDMYAATQRIGAMDGAQFFLPYALIMTFIALKCALVPLYGWLPKAHGTPGAPFSVSAMLSGLHIKSGLYLFLRFQDIFQGIALTEFFLVVGILTAIVGFVMALAQTDIKLILAYSTIAQIGLIMTSLNIYGPYSYTGSLYHIVNHAMSKSALFLSAGMIVKVYGTRDITKIRGVLRQNPVVGVAAIMAGLGIIGAPMFGGSISKYFMMADVDWLLTSVMVFINLGTILVFIKFSQIFFGRSGLELGDDAAKPDGCQQTSTFVLGLLCLVLGIFGEVIIGFLFGTQLDVSLAGYLEKIAIFAVSLVAGYCIFRWFVKGSNALLANIRKIDLGFREMCISMGVFFAALLIVVSLS